MRIRKVAENRKNPKVAVIDMLLAYPPNGGAGVDLFNNFKLLQNSFEIKAFGIRFEKQPPKAPQDFQRGHIDSTPPVDCKLLTLNENNGREEIINKLLEEVSDWNPDIVFIGDGWTLKPYIVKAFAGKFKTIVRLYAYEMLCPRNNQKWLFDHKCPNNALSDCRQCLECAADYGQTVRENRNGDDNPLTFEAKIARIWDGDYCETLDYAVKNASYLVYNSATADLLRRNGVLSVTKLPGAVDCTAFSPQKNREKESFHIVVCGRMDDRAKGAAVAVRAGEILKEKGIEIKMTITAQEKHFLDWLTETGWISKDDIIELLKTADCALVPSLWEEAFGMTWVEAAAMGVPIVASRTGGLAEYIHDGKTGLLAVPGNAADFAEKIQKLHSDEKLRTALAKNARKAVEETFTWQNTSKIMEGLFRKIISENVDPGNQNKD